MIAKRVVVDVIHMRYEWLYQLGRLDISADEISKRVKELQAIEGRVDKELSK